VLGCASRAIGPDAGGDASDSGTEQEADESGSEPDVGTPGSGCPDDALEPSDTLATATKLSNGDWVEALVCFGWDAEDLYRVDLDSSALVYFTVETTEAPVTLQIEFFNSNGLEVYGHEFIASGNNYSIGMELGPGTFYCAFRIVDAPSNGYLLSYRMQAYWE
jgi:hypothetical protein